MRDQDKQRQHQRTNLRPRVTDPAPQPTAFGAPTVGGAVAAAAMAGHGRVGEPDVRDEETVAPRDGSLEEQSE